MALLAGPAIRVESRAGFRFRAGMAVDAGESEIPSGSAPDDYLHGVSGGILYLQRTRHRGDWVLYPVLHDIDGEYRDIDGYVDHGERGFAVVVSFKTACPPGGVDPRQLQGVVREVLSSRVCRIVCCFRREVALGDYSGFADDSCREYACELRVSLVFRVAFSFFQGEGNDRFGTKYIADAGIDLRVARDRGSTYPVPALVVVWHLDSYREHVGIGGVDVICYLSCGLEKGVG